jgi:hypothetical protein
MRGGLPPQRGLFAPAVAVTPRRAIGRAGAHQMGIPSEVYSVFFSRLERCGRRYDESSSATASSSPLTASPMGKAPVRCKAPCKDAPVQFHRLLDSPLVQRSWPRIRGISVGRRRRTLPMQVRAFDGNAADYPKGIRAVKSASDDREPSGPQPASAGMRVTTICRDGNHGFLSSRCCTRISLRPSRTLLPPLSL